MSPGRGERDVNVALVYKSFQNHADTCWDSGDGLERPSAGWRRVKPTPLPNTAGRVLNGASSESVARLAQAPATNRSTPPMQAWRHIMVRKSSDNNKPEVNAMSHDLKLSHKRMSVVYAG